MMVGLVSGVQHDPAAAAGGGRPADGEGHQTGLTPLMSSSLYFFFLHVPVSVYVEFMCPCYWKSNPRV